MLAKLWLTLLLSNSDVCCVPLWCLSRKQPSFFTRLHELFFSISILADDDAVVFPIFFSSFRPEMESKSVKEQVEQKSLRRQK